MTTQIVKRAFSVMAVGALLASIGCAVQPGEPGAGESTASETTTQTSEQPAPTHAAHWERLTSGDPIENLRSVTPEEKPSAVSTAACSPGLIPCGYCEGYMFCTTFYICEKICGDRG